MRDDLGNVGLAFVAQAVRDLTTDVRTLQDDIRVVAAIVQRMDGTLPDLVNEIRDPLADERVRPTVTGTWVSINGPDYFVCNGTRFPRRRKGRVNE